MLKKILLIVLVLVVLAVIIIFAIFYKGDLTKAELADEYINKQSQFMPLDGEFAGATMHYRDEGNPDAPVLVMVHGGFGSLHNWEGWIEPLKDDYRLISMDLLGHGLTGAYPKNVYDRYTERDAIHQLLQKLAIDYYSVAGNSFGGGIALELALKFPDEIDSLILVDSEGIPNSEDGYDISLFSDADLVIPASPSYTQLAWYEKLGSNFIGPTVIKSTLDSMTYNKDLLTDDYVDHFGRILRYDGNREAQLLMFPQGLYLISQNDKMDLLPRLPEITCPVLVMQGAEDTLLPLDVAKKFNDNLPNSELAVINEAGHMPMIEKPVETVEIVKGFLDGVRN